MYSIQNAHPVDVVVGMNVRRLRKDRGLSQEKLAEAVDLTFQQIQKYERGQNRISASMLSEIAKALEVKVQDLFPPQDWDVQVETGASWVADAQYLSTCHPHMFEALVRLTPAQINILLATAQAFLKPSVGQVAA